MARFRTKLEPSEALIIASIDRYWKQARLYKDLGLPQPDIFNTFVLRAADNCGVSYDRAWDLATRAYDLEKNAWMFPCGGVGHEDWL